MRRPLLQPLVLATLVACSRSHVETNTSPGAATTIEITEADLRRRLEIVADDSMLGRESGRLGNVRATDYVARELARLRLEPAGDGGTFFQAIPLITRRIDTVSVLLVYAPGASADARAVATLLNGRDLAPLRPLGGTPFGAMFHGARVPVVYGGRIGDANMVDPAAAAGKFVVFAPRREADGSLGATFAGTGGALGAYRAAWGIAIAGLEQLAPPLAAVLRQPRDVLADPAMPAPPGIPGVVLTTDAAERLLGAPVATVAVGASGGSVGGHVAFVDGPTPFPARNVIGIVRGTDPMLRNEYVAIGAHTDHVGIAAVAVDHDSVRAFNGVVRPGGANEPVRAPTADEAVRIRAIRDSLARIRPPRRDSIFNGADDDGSGTVVALELAEWFSVHRPRRSLLFVFHTAEEKGLYGAMYFTDHPTVPRDAIVAQLNMDQVSRGGPDDVRGASPDVLYTIGQRRLSSELGRLVDAANARQTPPFMFDPILDAPGHPANAYCRSDHYMYARYGIPIAFFSRGWHRDYHMVTDEVQYADVAVMRRVGTFVRDVATSVADLDHRPVVDAPKPDPKGTCRQ